jgi:type IV pilus assembly protein PilQ
LRDFPGTANALGRSQTVNGGELRSINIVRGGQDPPGAQPAVILPVDAAQGGCAHYPNKLQPLRRIPPLHYCQHLQSQSAVKPMPFATLVSAGAQRGRQGHVDLSHNNVGIDIRQQGPNLVVEFLKTGLPENLRRRMEVNDFATPVTTINALPQGENARLIISPKGLWEHNAYQSDNQFVIEVKTIIEDPNKLVQGYGRGFQGEKLSLNFQNIDVRAVLQVIADFTDFNIITSDTCRQSDFEFGCARDQALDIICRRKAWICARAAT